MFFVLYSGNFTGWPWGKILDNLHNGFYKCPNMISYLKNSFYSIRWVAQSLLLTLSFFFLYRFVFWIYYSDSHSKVVLEQSVILNSLYIGMKMDLRVISIILSFGLFLKLIGLQIILTPLRVLLTFFIGLFYFIDFATMSYLQQRASANLLKLASEGSASLGMVWQSYPVIKCFLALIAITVLFEILVKKIIYSVSKQKQQLTWKSSLLPFLILFGLIYGQLAFYPLRWSDAYFSTNHFITQFTLNPILHFYQSYGFRKVEFDREKARKYYPIVAKYLGVNEADLDLKNLNYGRKIAAKPGILPPRTNIVIFVMESMATFKTNLGKNPLNPTPYLEKLASESIYFDRYYVPVQATARSIFSLMTGIPDVAFNKTSSRNPLTVEHHCLMNYFTDHEKYYFLGGSSNWGNIEGLFGRNIKGINIRDSNFDSPRADVWGISDYHLFLEAHKEFEKLHQNNQPFVAIVQSSGYHRPYTLPKNIEGFDYTLKKNEQELKQYGHSSLEEFNSLRFQDFALGNYFQVARKSAYYENTLYVVFGDHGLPHENAQQSSQIHKELLLDNWHVPLLLHAKKYFAPEVKKDLFSELDIFPTLLGLLGKGYENTTLGFDVWEQKSQNKSREIFTFSWWARPAQYGLMEEKYYYRGQYEQSGDIYEYNLDDVSAPLVGLKNNLLYNQRFKEMEDLSIGIYETARYMLYHNKEKEQK